MLGTSDNKSFKTYVGWTNNLDLRLKKHNSGSGARSTRGRKWSLLYIEKLSNKRLAMSREWHLKKDRTFREQFSRQQTTKH